MKFVTLLITFLSLFTTQALAHTDHALGEGNFHAFYHIAFWVIAAIVLIKAIKWFNAKKHTNRSK